MNINWKALIVCVGIIPIIAIFIVTVLKIPFSNGGNVYIFSAFTGILLILITGICEESLFNDSVIESGNYRDFGYVLFISGMTPFIPFFNPVNIVPLFQFLLLKV